MRKMIIIPAILMLTLFFLSTNVCTAAPAAQPSEADEDILTVKGSITWTDEDNDDGQRPYAVYLYLMEGDEEIDRCRASVVNNWVYEFDHAGGAASIRRYSVRMDDVEGYEITSSKKTADEGHTLRIDFTAVHSKASLTAEGEITWDDDNDRDGIRPSELTVTLLAGDTKALKQVASEENGWKFSFEGLDKFRESREIRYSISSPDIDGYETIPGSLAVRYRHVPEAIDVKGTVSFDDNDNQDGIRPDAVKIYLVSDGEETGAALAKREWGYTWSFEGLPKNSRGTPIRYTIRTENIAGYEASVSGYAVLYKHSSETTSVSGSVIWNDNGDEKGLRPPEVEIILYSGSRVEETRAVSENDRWKYNFTELPKYRNGCEISYTVGERDINGYRTEQKGTDIVNSVVSTGTVNPVDPGQTILKSRKEPEKKKGNPAAAIPVVMILAGGAAGGFLWHKRRQEPEDDE